MPIDIKEVNRAPLVSPVFTGTPTAPTPTQSDSSTKLATTAFAQTLVTNAIAGVNPAVAVQAATTTTLPNSPIYVNGVSGIGATITTLTLNTALTIDGYTLALNDRVLVKNESGGLGAAKNGIYFLSQLQTVGLPWILTRALDYDQPSDINNTGAIPVINGTDSTGNKNTSWVTTSSIATVGTDAITYQQFTYSPTITARNTLGLNQFASTTSAQLAGTVSDETGSGLLVFGTSPTLITPIIGATTFNGIGAFTATATLTANSNLLISSRETMVDANKVFSTGKTQVELTVLLTAARTLTLPTASSFNAGTELIFTDAIQGVTATNTIAITPNGTDTINGINSAFTLFTGGLTCKLTTDGSTKWTGGITTSSSDGTFSNWTSTLTGFSVNPTGPVSRYILSGKLCTCYINFTGSVGTSNATTKTMTLPFAAANTSTQTFVGHGQDNGVAKYVRFVTRVNSNIVDIFLSETSTTWTASGNCIFRGTLDYETV